MKFGGNLPSETFWNTQKKYPVNREGYSKSPIRDGYIKIALLDEE